MYKTELKLIVQTENDFFAKGKQIARLADARMPIPHSMTIAFEDIYELIQFLSKQKIELIREIKKQPITTSNLAIALGRSKRSVKRDAVLLLNHGILTAVEDHSATRGREVLLKLNAEEIVLEAHVS